MDEKIKQLQGCIQEHKIFKKSESYRLILFLSENRTMISILSKNYYELKMILKYHNDEDTIQKFWISNVYFRNRLQKEITRHLLNYLSSIFTVVDYTRKSVYSYLKGNDSVRENYDLKLKEYIQNSKYHKFIQDLRNYTSHNTYIKIGSEFSYNIEWEAPRKSIFTTKSELLKWDGWSKESRSVIEESDDKIRLNEIIKMHYDDFLKFQNWAFLQIFKVDISKTKTAIDELDRITSIVKVLNQKNLFMFSESYLRLLWYCYKKSLKSF